MESPAAVDIQTGAQIVRTARLCRWGEYRIKRRQGIGSGNDAGVKNCLKLYGNIRPGTIEIFSILC